MNSSNTDSTIDKKDLDFATVLASSVHDMKNSIGMLLASVENMIDDFPDHDSQQAKHFSTLHYEASRINGELVQLLALYKMENQLLSLRLDEHYVVDLLEDQVARNSRLCHTSGIELVLDCDDILRWYFDIDLLGGVVHNILVNCARYTHSKIKVSAAIDNDLLRIAIEDDGVGYPDNMLLDPASMSREAKLSKGKTHLGLFFAQEIASLHRQKNRHGYIRLSNNGSLAGGCFELFLP